MDKIKKLQILILKEKPIKSDAIVWLQGDRFDRAKKTLELYRKKISNIIIITGNNILIGPDKRPGENNISLDEMKNYLLNNGVKEEEIIIDHHSLNTRDQALNVILMAKKFSWTKLIIVGSYPHCHMRYFLTFLKAATALEWKGQIINQVVKIPLNNKPGGRGKNAKAILLEECKKIKEYRKKGHLVTTREGIDYLSKKLTFKKASTKDAGLLLKWRNDPELRKKVFTQHRIKRVDHMKWLKDVFNDEKRFLYIILNWQNKKIGSLRFDTNVKAEITISIAKEYRGKGYGAIAIKNASDFFLRSNSLNIKKIFARVLENNVASQKAFIAAGYRQIKTEGNIIHYLYE